MAKKIPRVYWDSCIFIALVKNETTHGERVLRHIEEMHEKAIDSQIEIATSSLWRLEIRPDNHHESYTILEAHFDRGNFLSISASENVFKKVLDIQIKLGKKVLQLADTIHIASAMIAECSVFYTLDDELLKCSGRIPGLKICRPESEQWIFE